MVTIEVCLIIITSIFFLIAIILLALVVKLVMTLSHVDENLIEARLLEVDLKNKMASLNPLFNSVENVGEVIESKSASFRNKQCNCENCEEEDSSVINVADIAALAGIGLRLWDKFSKRR